MTCQVNNTHDEVWRLGEGREHLNERTKIKVCHLFVVDIATVTPGE